MNLFDEEERGSPIRIDIEIQKQTLAFCNVSILDGIIQVTQAVISIAKMNPQPDSKSIHNINYRIRIV